ncbi:Flp family type IVb pilin [Ilumatobacter sp.]|uniref:Flp family type IVb pilin n=1 Tax=Ilumatobacter sp. TaxID=1967498 RepID=UPI003B5225E3
MKNIVDQYTSEIEVADDEGVVAMEYVIVAAAIVAALAGLWTAFGTTLSTRLQSIVSGI